jgi:hypothetical protein
MSDPNIQLMTEIRDEWGAQISRACQASSVRPEFIAALVAGESGGKVDAKRFEPAVLHALWEVLLGRKKNFGSILRSDLLVYALPAAIPASFSASDGRVALAPLLTPALERIDNLSTSWGLTQIMGYQVLERYSGIASTEDLILPARSLVLTLRLLAQFALQFELGLSTDFSDLFACWNTGSPAGKTADPEYIPRGLARMEIYAQLPPPAEAST